MTTTAYQRFRRDVLGPDDADDTATVSDAAIDDLIEEAGDTYTGAAATAYSRVLYLRGKLAEMSDEVNYTQNETREEAEARFRHYQELLAYWETRTDQDAAGAGIGAATVFATVTGQRGR